MTTISRKFFRPFIQLVRGAKHRPGFQDHVKQKFYPNNNTTTHEVVEEHRKSRLSQHPEVLRERDENTEVPRDFRYVSPEYLPNPHWAYRDRVLEKLEREDMYRRRENVHVPEFYVGSLMAVTVSDPYAPGKWNRFVGICICRKNHGLRADFILRNVIDGQGLEVRYALYSPTLRKIEVLRLEKRLDDELLYLRDCPLEYSTVPFDMEPDQTVTGNFVPVNTIKVPLNPKPWLERWERKELKGVSEIPYRPRTKKAIRRAQLSKKDYEKYDLMKHYRESINDVEKAEIYREVSEREKIIEDKKGKGSKKK